MNKLSICYTLKNRAKMLEENLHSLTFQTYNLKQIEICITDGGSTDNILEVIEKFKDTFYDIKYNIADRSKLKFKILSNNPACDRNAQLCYQPTSDKVILTDPEVRFTDKNELNNIEKTLDEFDVLYYNAIFMDVEYNYDGIINKDLALAYPHRTYNGTSALCIGVRLKTFIDYKGFDIRFANGFACEDSQFLEWHRRNTSCKVMDNHVIHLYHPTQWTDYNTNLRLKYSLPLYKQMLSNNEQPNSHTHNDDWKCLEMIEK